VIVARANHWAVGWVETLYVRKDADSTLLARLDEMIGGLEDYPALDEFDWSELEWDEACDYWSRMSVSERVYELQRSDLCIFAARRSELPEDPNGRLFERLTQV
jgi:hypothetical protein